jgi:transketolase
MSIIPNITVIVPCDGPETKNAITSAYHHKGPVYVRLSRSKFPIITKEDDSFTIGKAKTVTEGNDITIIACGLMVTKSLEAVSILKQKGINARLINMHTIKPIDKNIIIKAAKETGAIVTAEEHSIIGGLGSITAGIITGELPVPIEMVGTKDCFGQSGHPDELCKKYNIDIPDIVTAGEKVLKRKNSK